MSHAAAGPSLLLPVLLANIRTRGTAARIARGGPGLEVGKHRHRTRSTTSRTPRECYPFHFLPAAQPSLKGQSS